MEVANENQAFDEAMKESARPQFLTVLCVLSFIWCALSFVYQVYSLVNNTPENMREKIEKMREISPESADKLEKNLDEMQDNGMMQVSAYLNISFTLLSFLGVLMMWKLKRSGFYIYTIAELIPYVVTLLVSSKSANMLNSMPSTYKNIAIVFLIFMVLFDIAFIVMYGMNLKKMDK
jgi:uncharacterized Tic20 family protein